MLLFPGVIAFDLGSIDISTLCTTDIALMNLESWSSRRMWELGDIVMHDQSCYVTIHARVGTHRLSAIRRIARSRVEGGRKHGSTN